MKQTHRIMRLAVLILATQVAGVADAQPAADRLPTFRIIDSVRIDTQLQRLMGALRMALRGDESIAVSGRGDVLILFDSTGRRRWARSLGEDLRTIGAIGWIRDSLFVIDNYRGEILFVGANGGVGNSVEFPDLVRPKWKDRRMMPAYNRLEVFAAMENGQMVGVPHNARSMGVYGARGSSDAVADPIVRIDGDGIVQKLLVTSASVVKGDRSFILPDGGLVVVRPGADSLAFTGISPLGDTTFSRRLRKVLAIVGVSGGPDGSLWMSATESGRKGIITHTAYDRHGVAAGRIELPSGLRIGAGDAHHLWVFGVQGDYRTLARYTLSR